MDLAKRLYAATYDRLGAAAERGEIGARRARLLGGLSGLVLELGGGTGANLPHYPHGVRLVVTEPDPHMRRRLTARAPGTPVVAAVAERLPFADGSFDAVVSTFVLCSVREPARAAAEAARVLRPGGALVVFEHVRAEGRVLAAAQDAITPATRLVSGNCSPNRPTLGTLAGAGFDVGSLERLPEGRLYPLVAGAVRPG